MASISSGCVTSTSTLELNLTNVTSVYDNCNSVTNCSNSFEDSEKKLPKDLKFDPPAYRQRYEAVKTILTDKRFKGKLRKIVDFGSGECNLYKYLKNIDGVEEVLFVDNNSSNLCIGDSKFLPSEFDYMCKRKRPLEFKFIAGCVTQNDPMLIGTDAVICIEFFIHPKVAVFTTPNIEFNVMFSQMKPNNLRHDDHKFEWTRQQFRDWAENVVLRYKDYNVEFQDVAKGPPETEHLGGCSQMAIFYETSTAKIHTTDLSSYPSYQQYGSHRFVVDYENLEKTDYKKILDEVLCVLYWWVYNLPEYMISDYLTVCIKHIRKHMRKYFPSDGLIISLLDDDGWTISYNSKNSWDNAYVIYPKDAIVPEESNEETESSDES